MQNNVLVTSALALGRDLLVNYLTRPTQPQTTDAAQQTADAVDQTNDLEVAQQTNDVTQRINDTSQQTADAEQLIHDVAQDAHEKQEQPLQTLLVLHSSAGDEMSVVAKR